MVPSYWVMRCKSGKQSKISSALVVTARSKAASVRLSVRLILPVSLDALDKVSQLFRGRRLALSNCHCQGVCPLCANAFLGGVADAVVLHECVALRVAQDANARRKAFLDFLLVR